MSARPVQVSIDEELLTQIDADPECRDVGRSAFVRNAVRLYLQAKERGRVDDAIRRAYAGQAETMEAEIEDLLGAQSWPSEP